jgi:hypothetical protein
MLGEVFLNAQFKLFTRGLSSCAGGLVGVEAPPSDEYLF